MEYLVTGQEMKLYDQMTIEQIGIPSMVLMERAALSVCRAIQREYGTVEKKSFLIFAGVGNNGADGLAMARLLQEEGASATVIVVGNKEKATEQWKCQAHILSEIGMEIRPFEEKMWKDRYDFVVDGLFGVGLSREVTGVYADAITLMNQMEGVKVALDMPSGIHTDRGDVMGVAFEADLTVTFQFRKLGLCLYPGVLYAGKTIVENVGISLPKERALKPKVMTSMEEPALLLPKRKPEGNKGTFGKVLAVAGSVNMAGAAILCAGACYRTGAGMVKVISPVDNREIIQRTLPEALYGTGEQIDADMKWANTIVIGPGLGKSTEAYRILRKVIIDSDSPILIDADGLNLLAENEDLQELLKEKNRAGRACILTPHVGELVRLLHEATIGEVKKDLSAFAFSLAKDYHCTVVAKDARTFICNEQGECFLNMRGNDGMAVAGSGDVLAGMTAALLGQGLIPYEAAYLGALLHGRMGELASGMLGRQGMLPGDMVGQLGPYFAQYLS